MQIRLFFAFAIVALGGEVVKMQAATCSVIGGKTFQNFLHEGESFVDAQLAVDESLNAVLVVVYLLDQRSHGIRHDDLCGQELVVQ